MFHTIFYVPLYNALMALTSLFGGSLWFAVIGLTILVKIILIPLSYQSTKSQIEQKKLLPLVNQIKKKYPDTKEQAQKLNELYKEHKTHPLSGCLLVLLQLPILIAITYVFRDGASINPADLYFFITAPTAINPTMFGINITEPSIIILIITAIVQYLQIELSPAMQTSPQESVDANDSQAAMAASMQKTMKYILPVMIVLGGWKLPGAVALYWTISSAAMILQERWVMRKLKA